MRFPIKNYPIKVISRKNKNPLGMSVTWVKLVKLDYLPYVGYIYNQPPKSRDITL